MSCGSAIGKDRVSCDNADRLGLYRRTTGQAARSIPLWTEQTVAIAAAAEPIVVKVTAAVLLEWAAANLKVVDPLL